MALIHFYKIFLSRKNNLTNKRIITSYDLRDLLSYIWGQKYYKRSIKMNNHLYSLCDYDEPKSKDGVPDKTIKFFCIDESLSHKPYEGKPGASNKTKVQNELYNPTFCLLLPKSHILMTLGSNESPSYKSIANYLLKYINSNYHHHKMSIKIIPISIDIKFNKLKDKNYKIKKASVKVDPKEMSQASTKRDFMNGFGNLLNNDHDNDKSKLGITISLTNDGGDKTLSYENVDDLRQYSYSKYKVKDFEIKATIHHFPRTINFTNSNKNSKLTEELNLGTNHNNKNTGPGFIRDKMYQFYQNHNNDTIDKAIKSLRYNMKPISSQYIHKCIPRDVYHHDETKRNTKEHKK